MSIADKFEQFHKNILIDKTDIANISYRYKQITKRLNLDFWGSDSETSHSLYVGSYGRDTDIHISDVDVILELPVAMYEKYNNYTTNGQSALLQVVKESIQKTYKTTESHGNGQVVAVDFTDGIKYEVVPVFPLKDNKGYYYPDTHNGGSWKITNPKPEIKAINDKNQEWNKNLKRLCRMMRAWKDVNDVPMGGLLIDTFAHNFLKSWEYKDKSYMYYDWMVRDFFEYLKEQNQEQTYWLAVGSNQYVWRKGKFEPKAIKAYNAVIEAIKFEDAKQEYSANLKWREVFGTKFPN